MNNLSFFSMVANNFRDRYAYMSKWLDQATAGSRLPWQNNDQRTAIEPPPPTTETPKDEYIPTPESQLQAKAAQTESPIYEKPMVDLADGDEVVPVDADSVSPEADSASADAEDTSFSYSRLARLDYGSELKFDLSAILHTAQVLSNGETEAAESFFGGGFGLSAELYFKGMEKVVSQGGPEVEHPEHSMNKYKGSMNQASQFSANSRDFALNSFSNQAEKLRGSSRVINNKGHRLAINKFSYRFRMDSQFSVGNLSRFNMQTKQVADTNPDSLNRYVDSAGSLAEYGNDELMATFFDTVQGYLDGAEEQLIAKATAAFDAAAEQLGFSGEMMESAKEQFVASIESFFDRVDTAVSAIRTQFVPEPIVAPSEFAVEPMVDSDHMTKTDPAVTDKTEEMAMV